MSYSRIVRHLDSRYSAMADMAIGVYLALERDGLGLPSARTIAEMCGISPSSLSRRMQGRAGLEELLLRLVSARDYTLPPGFAFADTWAAWLPQTDEDLADARVWAACEHLAIKSEPLAASVVDVWDRQRGRMQGLLSEGGDDAELLLQGFHALCMGLTTRMCVQPDFGHADALAVLEACATVLASGHEAA